jgi:hypothetical protein
MEELFLAPAKAGVHAKPFLARIFHAVSNTYRCPMARLKKRLLEPEFELSMNLSGTSSASETGS